MSNEAKYTPGPWRIAELQGGNVREEKRRLIRPVDDKNYEFGAVAYVYGDESKINKANAALIAAAPDLLEALKLMVEMIAFHWHEDTLPKNETDVPMQAASAAIAKAKS